MPPLKRPGTVEADHDRLQRLSAAVRPTATSDAAFSSARLDTELKLTFENALSAANEADRKLHYDKLIERLKSGGYYPLEKRETPPNYDDEARLFLAAATQFALCSPQKETPGGAPVFEGESSCNASADKLDPRVTAALRNLSQAMARFDEKPQLTSTPVPNAPQPAAPVPRVAAQVDQNGTLVSGSDSPFVPSSFDELDPDTNGDGLVSPGEQGLFDSRNRRNPRDSDGPGGGGGGGQPQPSNIAAAAGAIQQPPPYNRSQANIQGKPGNPVPQMPQGGAAPQVAEAQIDGSQYGFTSPYENNDPSSSYQNIIDAYQQQVDGLGQIMNYIQSTPGALGAPFGPAGVVGELAVRRFTSATGPMFLRNYQGRTGQAQVTGARTGNSALGAAQQATSARQPASNLLPRTPSGGPRTFLNPRWRR